MLVDKTEIEVTGTLAGEKVGMTFDEASLPHLMSQFIDLYKDAEMACLREYSTNALDSHIEAGNDAPIEVTLPNPLSPFLKIRDFGIGLNGSDIRDIYSKYGASTKRGSNDFQGQLGLGSKSALTYTNQFTLTGIKDGQMTTVAISRQEDGGGSMTIVNETATDRANGVEVIIPTKTGNYFIDKASKLYKYWKPGTVLVNGKEPEPFQPLVKIADDMFIMENQTQTLIVMGGVAYPVEDEVLPLDLPYQVHGLFFVPIGAVNFTPSRELLRMTPKTKATLEQLRTSFLAEREKAVQAEIAKCSTLFEAIDTYKKYKAKVANTNLKPFNKFKHRSIPERLEFPDRSVITDGSLGWHKKSEHSPANNLHMEAWPNTVFVKNWSQSRFTASTKKKLVKWLDIKKADTAAQNDTFRHYSINNFVLVPDDFKQSLIPKVRIIDWEEEVKPIKLEYRKGGSPKTAGCYDTYLYSDDKHDDYADWQMNLSIEDFPDYDMYFATYSRNNRKLSTELKIMKENHEEFMIVSVTANRLKKFEGLYPNAKSLSEECRRLADLFADSIDEETLSAYQLNSYSNDSINKLKKLRDWLGKHPEDNIEDPRIHEFINLISFDLTEVDKSASLYGGYLTLQKNAIAYRDHPIFHMWDDYVLLEDLYHYTIKDREMKDIILYINFKYRMTLIDHCEEWGQSKESDD